MTNAKLANSIVTVTAGSALTDGGSVALGSSVALDVAVDGSTIEKVNAELVSQVCYSKHGVSGHCRPNISSWPPPCAAEDPVRAAGAGISAEGSSRLRECYCC
jgi:hypothetical protein